MHIRIHTLNKEVNVILHKSAKSNPPSDCLAEHSKVESVPRTGEMDSSVRGLQNSVRDSAPMSKQGVLACTCGLSPREVKAGRSLKLSGYPALPKK